MKDPARLGGEEEWPCCAAQARAVDAPETTRSAPSRLVEGLKLIASLIIIVISMGIMMVMFRDIPMLSG
jgi:hypothetical protein